MQPQPKRWMKMMSKNEQSLTQSRSKSKKYNPVRNSGYSDLNDKIKLLSNSRINSSVDLELATNKQQLRQSLSKIADDQNQSPSRRQRFQNFDLKIKPVLADQPGSPNIIIKKLKQIQKQQQEKNLRPTKVLFSLDQEHRYIHQQLSKIKNQYIKFKQMVSLELMKIKKEINQIVRSMENKMKNILQSACPTIQIPNLQINLKDQYDPEKQKGISIDGFLFDNLPFQNKIQPNCSQIAIKNQNSLLTDSKNQIRKDLGIENIKTQENMTRNTKEGAHNKSKYQASKTDRVTGFNTQLNSEQLKSGQPNGSNRSANNSAEKNELKKNTNERMNLLKSRSKKQFQKLFQAVNCLKKDIKDLKSIGDSRVTSSKLQAMNNQSLKGLSSRTKTQSYANFK